MADKATVKIDGISLAANSSVTWVFHTGVAPYTTVMQVHKSQWRALERKIGEFVELDIRDARGVRHRIQDVTILHQVASDSPNRVSFVVADRRWKWDRQLVVRDYNVPARTGTQLSAYEVPFPSQITVDQYIYKEYSTSDGKKHWTAKEILEDVLDQVEDDNYDIDDFPIESEELGSFSVQNLNIYDNADAAISRVLSHLPGTDLYIGADGRVKVIDTTDLSGTESHLEGLPPTTWDGEFPIKIDKAKIRPKRVLVYYVREVEARFIFEDDYDTTQTFGRSRILEPYLDNVCPTVDPQTTVDVFDPLVGEDIRYEDVAPGTWVVMQDWFDAMDQDKPADSMPWQFETIQSQWVAGDLNGVLGARGLDISEDSNLAARVNTLRQHFRQTFRINRRYMGRIQDVLNVRAGLLDPFSGTRTPAAVWGQGCIVPSDKGKRMSHRFDDDQSWVYRNEDYLKDHLENNEALINTPFGPQAVQIVDRDSGIFRSTFYLDPYGLTESWIPCNTVNGATGMQDVVSRGMQKQDTDIMGANMEIDGGGNGLFLSPTMKMHVILTIIPGAPNNKTKLHRIEVEPKDIAKEYRSAFEIEDGDGPDLEVFVPPGEATCRFGWGTDDDECENTLQILLGVGNDDPNESGIEHEDGANPEEVLGGYTFVNWQNEIRGHSRAVAAEAIAHYANSVQGRVSTISPRELKIVGNMGDVAINVASAPSGKVSTSHSFTGQARPISRFALLDGETRRQVLGILAFRSDVR